MADRKKPVVTFTCEKKLAVWLKTMKNKSEFLESLVRAAYRRKHK